MLFRARVGGQVQRIHPRFDALKDVDWDFYSHGRGAGRPGWITNLSRGGCLMHADEPIEHRRWIRLVVKDIGTPRLSLIVTGRVAWREDRMEAWPGETVTLHRFGIEFLQPFNPVALETLRNTVPAVVPLCVHCHERRATIPNAYHPGRWSCVLCHLRMDLTSPA